MGRACWSVPESVVGFLKVEQLIYTEFLHLGSEIYLSVSHFINRCIHGIINTKR